MSEETEKLPEQSKQPIAEQASTPQTQGTVTATIQQSHYSGPLPQASELEAYNRIDPTFATRIVAMAESFAEHAQRLEAEAVKQERMDLRWVEALPRASWWQCLVCAFGPSTLTKRSSLRR